LAGVDENLGLDYTFNARKNDEHAKRISSVAALITHSDFNAMTS